MKSFILVTILSVGLLFSGIPNKWVVDVNKYEYSASAIMKISGVDQSDSLNDAFAFFKDGICMGKSEQLYFPVDSTYLHLSMIYMNVTGLYNVYFYSAVNDTVYSLGNIKVKNDMIIGTPLKPKIFSIYEKNKNTKLIPKIFKILTK